MHPYAVRGKILQEVDAPAGEYDVNVTIPGKEQLTNYDVIAPVLSQIVHVVVNDEQGAHIAPPRPTLDPLLVLDPYGNEGLSGAVSERLFGRGGYTLAINRKTGTIYIASYFKSEGKLVLSLRVPNPCPAPPGGDDACPAPVVPKKYLKRLDELKSLKRPFNLTLSPWTARNFINRDIGYTDLENGIIVTLDFQPRQLEILGRSSREVTSWT